MIPMDNGGACKGSAGLGGGPQVAVDRALCEFRATRPVWIIGVAGLIALPVDGLDDAKLAAFRAASVPAGLQLVVSARRARALGLAASEPLALPVPAGHDANQLFSLVADVHPEPVVTAIPAGPTAAAALTLAKLALRLPAVVMFEPAGPGPTFSDAPLVKVAAEAIVGFRGAVTASLTRAGEAQIPLQDGVCARFIYFRDCVGGGAVAVIVGDPDFSAPVPVRLHSACLTGDVFGSRRCDCGDQLQLALVRLEAAGGGIILYLEQEGRGLGLANKLRAYQLQDCGLDTVDANTTLGFDDDERDYGVAGRMLEMLGCKRILLMTNNPAKLDGLARAGIEISGRVALHTPINVHNRRYLTAKAMRAGHRLDHICTTGSQIRDDGTAGSRSESTT